MRTTRDRLPRAIAFEMIGLALCIPLAVWVLGLQVREAGLLTIGHAGPAVDRYHQNIRSSLSPHGGVRIVRNPREGEYPARL